MPPPVRNDVQIEQGSQKGLRLARIVVIFGFTVACVHGPMLKTPPQTRRDNVKETLHGVEIVDPYRWLEDQNSPGTREWINAQNEYTDSIVDSLPGRERISQRLTELMKIDLISPPRMRNGRYFFYKRSADQEQWVIYMRQGLEGEDEVLIDPHPMSPDNTISVSLWDVSKDGTLMAYGVQEGGEDEKSVHLFAVDTRTDLPDKLPKARYFGFSLKNDKTGFYYVRHGDKGSRVFYHAIGTDPADDTMIFGEGYGPDKHISVYLSEDGHYLIISVWHGAAGDKTEIYYQDISKRGPITPIVSDIDARFYSHVGGDQLFLHTNWEAPNGRILVVDLENPVRDRWCEIIAESETVIRYFTLVGRKICVSYLENVISRVKIFEADGQLVREISFPAIGTVSGLSGRWESDEAFYSFSSFHIPPTTYRYDVQKGTQDVWARVEVPVDSEKFEVKQVWYKSKDGTDVPMFLVHGKEVRPDGSNPTLLNGYGGFTASLTPYFSSAAVLWVENGGVFAMPNLRGGGEFGEEWHKAGMLENKQNVFDDFIAAAEWLIENGYTRPSKLAISGGSNGGLLVGAALTQRPELFGAVVCSYPLLDMIRYHKFLVAQFWISEYGSSEDPEQFKYLYAYSPYHRVKQGAEYPAVLFISGDADTRVAPLHARKMVALLQSAIKSDKPILLRYDTTLGHSGGRPLSKQIEDETDELSFLFWQLGVTLEGMD